MYIVDLSRLGGKNLGFFEGFFVAKWEEARSANLNFEVVRTLAEVVDGVDPEDAIGSPLHIFASDVDDVAVSEINADMVVDMPTINIQHIAWFALLFYLFGVVTSNNKTPLE